MLFLKTVRVIIVFRVRVVPCTMKNVDCALRHDAQHFIRKELPFP
jgi:hypothetical protein